MGEREELLTARIAAAFAVVAAGVLGIYPPAYVAQVVAFAFGLAAASFFPVLVLGIFSLRATKQGAIAGMSVGVVFTAAYIVYFKLFGISPEGIGTIGMLLNFAVAIGVSLVTPPPSASVRALVERIRLPGDR
jgi:cation/acetate symporter